MPSINDILILLPEIYLVVAACVLLLLDAYLKPGQKGAVHWLSILVLLVGAYLVVSGQPASSVSAFGGMFIRDGVAEVLKVFSLLITAWVATTRGNELAVPHPEPTHDERAHLETAHPGPATDVEPIRAGPAPGSASADARATAPTTRVPSPGALGAALGIGVLLGMWLRIPRRRADAAPRA